MAYIDADKFAEEICNFPAIDEDSANAVISLLRRQPTANVVEVKHGKWKRINHGTICTNCYRVFDNDFEFSNKDIRTYFKRCPECGAKMEEDKKCQNQ